MKFKIFIIAILFFTQSSSASTLNLNNDFAFTDNLSPSSLKPLNLKSDVRKLLGLQEKREVTITGSDLSETLPQVSTITVLEDINLGSLEPSLIFKKIINRLQKSLNPLLSKSFIEYFAKRFGYEMIQDESSQHTAVKSTILTVPGLISTPGLSTQSSAAAAASSSSSNSENKITLHLPDGTKKEILQGFDELAYSRAFKLLRSGWLIRLVQETQNEKEVRKLTISASDYNLFKSEFPHWNSAQHVQLERFDNFDPRRVFLARMDSPAFAHKERAYVILGTAGVCDCVVIIGYNPKTTQTFMIHASSKFDPHELEILIPKLGSKQDGELRFYLVTRQLATHSERILETIKKIAPSSQIFVSSVPGLLQKIEHLNDSRVHIEEFINPKLIDFAGMKATFLNPDGISVFFDSRIGAIHY